MAKMKSLPSEAHGLWPMNCAAKRTCLANAERRTGVDDLKPEQAADRSLSSHAVKQASGIIEEKIVIRAHPGRSLMLGWQEYRAETLHFNNNTASGNDQNTAYSTVSTGLSSRSSLQRNRRRKPVEDSKAICNRGAYLYRRRQRPLRSINSLSPMLPSGRTAFPLASIKDIMEQMTIIRYRV